MSLRPPPPELSAYQRKIRSLVESWGTAQDQGRRYPLKQLAKAERRARTPLNPSAMLRAQFIIGLRQAGMTWQDAAEAVGFRRASGAWNLVQQVHGDAKQR